jgi:hypothetical protein
MSDCGASSAGVFALEDAPSVSPPSLGSALLLGAPNENPRNLDDDAVGFESDSASGVRGGLPKAKPTGLPRLPPDEEPKASAEGPPPMPNADLVGVEVRGLSPVPKVKPPAKALVEAFPESFLSSFETLVEKKLLEKMEGVVVEASAGLLDDEPKVNGLGDDAGGPKVNAVFRGAEVEAASDVTVFSSNANELDLVKSIVGLKPPPALVAPAADEEADGGLKLVKLVGGAGIVKEGLEFEADEEVGLPKVNGLLVLADADGAGAEGLELPNVKAGTLFEGATDEEDVLTFLVSSS